MKRYTLGVIAARCGRAGIPEDRWPDPVDLVALDGEHDRRDRLRARGLIRPADSFIAGVERCERRPDLCSSPCLRDRGHGDQCVVARLVPGGAVFLRDGVEVMRLDLPYPAPTRAELAEEWMGRELLTPRAA